MVALFGAVDVALKSEVEAALEIRVADVAGGGGVTGDLEGDEGSGGVAEVLEECGCGLGVSPLIRQWRWRRMRMTLTRRTRGARARLCRGRGGSRRVEEEGAVVGGAVGAWAVSSAAGASPSVASTTAMASAAVASGTAGAPTWAAGASPSATATGMGAASSAALLALAVGIWCCGCRVPASSAVRAKKRRALRAPRTPSPKAIQSPAARRRAPGVPPDDALAAHWLALAATSRPLASP